MAARARLWQSRRPAAGSGARRPATDPIGRPISARWLRSADGRRAVVELAEASGLSRLKASERDPVGASTQGTGEVIRSVLDEGIRTITLGIGGSATTDGGAGILRALGAAIDDGLGAAMGGPHEARDARGPRVDLAGLIRDSPTFTCESPAMSPTHSWVRPAPPRPMAPKRARPLPQVARLDAALSRFADGLRATTGRDERETPGAGAAGGTAFGLLSVAGSFRSVRLIPGVEVVVEETGLREKLTGADLVITGEGRIDAQTAFGKTALGVAQLAKAAGVACIAVGGGVTAEGIEALAGLAIVVPVTEEPISLEAAMAAGTAPIERCGERLARLVSLGGVHV